MVNRTQQTAGWLRLFALVGGGAAMVLLAWTGLKLVTWPDVATLSSTDPQSTAFIDRYRSRRQADATLRPLHWSLTDAISPFLARAVVCAEDMEFFDHAGFSTHEIRTAIREAITEGEAPRGASTITQQLAKNLWLSPSRSPVRKIEEALLTTQLERHLTKERILYLYMNVVEFGPGIYGAESAATYYFAKHARDLSPMEAAQLAAALPRPTSWNPASASGGYGAHVDRVWDRMRSATYLDRYIPGSAITPDVILRDQSR